MANFLFHSLFHSRIQASDEKWTIMRQGISNKCGSFENDIQLQLGSYSYLTTWPVIKVAFGRIKIIFYHKEEIQTGGNRKCCNRKSWMSKILNSRTSLKNGIFSSSFPAPKKIQNNLTNSRIEYPETLCMKFDVSPSYFSPPDQLMVPPSYFENSPTPNKGNFEILQPPS